MKTRTEKVGVRASQGSRSIFAPRITPNYFELAILTRLISEQTPFIIIRDVAKIKACILWVQKKTSDMSIISIVPSPNQTGLLIGQVKVQKVMIDTFCVYDNVFVM